MKVCFEANLQLKKWRCWVPPRFQRGFPPTTKLEAFRWTAPRDGKVRASFVRPSALVSGGYPTKPFFKVKVFLKRSSERIAPHPHTHKMRATAYISGDFSRPVATKHFLVEFVKQNKPQIAGRQKRKQQGRYPHFGKKRLPVYPKIIDISQTSPHPKLNQKIGTAIRSILSKLLLQFWG